MKNWDLQQAEGKCIIRLGRKFKEHINVFSTENEDISQSLEAQTNKRQGSIKYKLNENLQLKWKKKKMHGQLQRDMEKLSIDGVKSFAWLLRGNLRANTEGLLIAA